MHVTKVSHNLNSFIACSFYLLLRKNMNVNKACDAYNIPISKEEFHTVASWIFINKGRPNEEDFKRLDEFLDRVLSN